MAEPEKILFAVEAGVATITLNRPDKLNALDTDMLDGLERLVAQIDADRDIRVVILRAAGERAFCAGADINAWADLKPLGMWHTWIRRGHQIFGRLADLRQPSIAAIAGIAFGGGLELALSCDLRVAADSAKFALPEVTIATVPGWTGTQRLPLLIGEARAKQMVLTGQRIDAQTAAQWGLINEAVPMADLDKRAHELARQIAANAPVSVQTAKQLVNAGLGRDTAATLEALAGSMTGFTEDAVEGRAAWAERRPPKFTGK
ncbi:MAG: enoyl-CoA hydratase-related protein [Rhodospirillales bacterium]|jgi:enoyl-CoA hydratase/carnithine racemase|nr:enoyl-CoA hydratase-related protein [Rhodospirillales bacterium]